MALSKQSVHRAWNILSIIDPEVKAGIIQHNDDNKHDTHIIFGYNQQADGGWESIHLNVKDITESQKELFRKMETVVPNSSVMNDLGNGITRIGWY